MLSTSKAVEIGKTPPTLPEDHFSKSNLENEILQRFTNQVSFDTVVFVVQIQPYLARW
jgi:hypothetical protein